VPRSGGVGAECASVFARLFECHAAHGKDRVNDFETAKLWLGVRACLQPDRARLVKIGFIPPAAEIAGLTGRFNEGVLLRRLHTRLREYRPIADHRLETSVAYLGGSRF
jgi:hypothetical protein